MLLETTVGDLFSKDNPHAVSFHRLAVVHDDLAFELSRLVKLNENEEWSEIQFQEVQYLTRNTVSNIHKAQGLLFEDGTVDQWIRELRGQDDLRKEIVALRRKFRRDAKFLVAVRNKATAHLDVDVYQHALIECQHLRGNLYLRDYDPTRCCYPLAALVALASCSSAFFDTNGQDVENRHSSFLEKLQPVTQLAIKVLRLHVEAFVGDSYVLREGVVVYSPSPRWQHCMKAETRSKWQPALLNRRSFNQTDFSLKVMFAHGQGQTLPPEAKS